MKLLVILLLLLFSPASLRAETCSDALYPWAKSSFGLSPGIEMKAEPIMYPGKLAIRFRPDVEASKVKEILGSYALEEGLWSYGSFYIVEVGQRHEEQWKQILSQQKSIDLVCRYPIKTASIDADSIYIEAHRINSMNPSPYALSELAHTNTISGSVKDAALSFLREKYNGKGSVEIEKESDLRIKINIEGLRSEVLKNHKYWEKLTLNIIFANENDGIRILLIADGYYASGLGKRAPPDDAFNVMDRKYYSDLLRYANTLLITFKARQFGKT